MLEKITFTNHINESMEWGSNGIYVNYNDLHDYTWDFTANGSRISSFSKGIVEKTIPLIICCDSVEDGLEKKNQLMEICEKDVLSLQHGKLTIGDYYIRCYITGSKKGNYLIHKGYIETTLTLTTEYPQWVKESLFRYMPSGYVITEPGAGNVPKRNHDYNFDYPYDYMSESVMRTVDNTGFIESNFNLIIYGAVTNPIIHIGGHTYSVDCTVEENEYLTIDSVYKTIILRKQDGTKVNKFNDRNRDSYIFKKIEPGENVVSWSGDFGFDVILLEERSEPLWT